MNDGQNRFSALWDFVRGNIRSLLIYGVLPLVTVFSVILFSIVFSGRISSPEPEVSGAQPENSVSVSEESTAPPQEDDDSSSAVPASPEVSGGTVSDTDPTSLPILSAESVLKYQEAQRENDDVKGWLSIPDSNVDFPVLQAHDNSFYLDKGLNRSYYYWGSIFAHFRNNMTAADKLSRNTVLFGHNKNDGMLFGSLMDFAGQEYADCHRFITLTVGEETTYWVIFSVMDCEVNNKVFYYINANPTDNELSDIILQAKDRSFWDYGLDVSTDDRLLTLSTCTYKYTYASGAFREDVRFVVMARELRPGESLTGLQPVSVNNDRRQPSF